MVSEKIQIIIVDDSNTTRDNIRKLLELETDMEVIGEASSGEEAIKKAKILAPHIVLMDVNMPVMDGITATETIANEMPQCQVIVISVLGEQEYLRKAMYAGAKDYLVKPFEGAALLECIRHVHGREQKRRVKNVQPPKEQERGKVITLFSTKGGVGKTTIATNFASALGLDAKSKISIMDMDLQFGDVALFLNTVPKTSIVDLVNVVENLDASVLNRYMTKYTNNVKILAAPFRPEQADDISAAQVTAIIKEMQYNYDYIVIDTAPIFNEITFTIMDLSDMIILVTSQDIPTLKNVSLCLEIMESLNYPAEKIKVILNRANSLGGMSVADSENLLKRKYYAAIPSDGKTVVTAANQGSPFVLTNPKTPVAKSIFTLAESVVKAYKKADTHSPTPTLRLPASEFWFPNA